MGVSTSIDIRLSNVRFSSLFQTLLDAGWRPYQNRILSYEHYEDTDDIGENVQTADPAQLTKVLALLEERSEAGEYVAVYLYWQSDAAYLQVQWHNVKGLSLFFDGTRPTLECAPRFTDFSWVLHRVLCPLVQAGYNVLSVVCIDDW